MTPFVRLLRNVWERLFGKFYDGPEPPERLTQMVQLFMIAHPFATRQQWAQFASKHSGETYKSGYVRGFEWAERDLDRKPTDHLEVMQHLEAHGWSWENAHLLDTRGNANDSVVLDEEDPQMLQHEIEAYNDSLRKYWDHGTGTLGKKYSR